MDTAIDSARSSKTSPDYLDELAAHESENVRAAVASNSSSPTATLLKLMGDESSFVLQCLRDNPNFRIGSNLEVSVCKHTRLRLAQIDDSSFILSLRTDPGLSKYVSPVENKLDQQKAWMKEYKNRERFGSEFYFIVESRSGQMFGTVRLYDFKPGSFCWGSWIIKKGAPITVAIESALSVYEFAFYDLGFKRCHFDVMKENKKVVKFHERFGAKRIANDEENLFFNYERKDYEIVRKSYIQFFAE